MKIISIVVFSLLFGIGCGGLGDSCDSCHDRCKDKGPTFHAVCDPNSFSNDNCLCVES
jgi:hypothetical protein